MTTTIIVACDPDGVIGKHGQLPWRVPEDLKLFRKRTMNHPIIMGRNTWEGLPKKPLDGRANIVISRTIWKKTDDSIGPFWYSSIDSALKSIEISPCFKTYDNSQVFIIGGFQIYRIALECNLVDTILMTKLKQRYAGNVYFPKLDNKWITVSTTYYEDFGVVLLRNKDRIEMKDYVGDI